LAATTRQQIVEAADRLFYAGGYARTSFADIAMAVKISRGNFYYHFKSKDEILDAVIGQRRDATQAMLAAWEAESEGPAARIRSFIRMLIANRADIMRHGCPAGTLCSELAKLDHAAADEAGAILGLFRDWLAQQFAEVGRGEDAEALALHLLMRSQGVATLASAFHEEDFIRREVAGMEAWLNDQI
jgi:AcrR family transcriptional regulator